MGQSNISSNLKDRIARVMGERQQVIRKIERIDAMVQELPATKEHLAHLDKVIDGIDVVLTDLDPTWNRETVIPIKPNGHRSPIAFGDGRRVALDVLKAATKKMTTREITDAVLDEQGLFDLDQPLWERIRSNIEGGLRVWEGVSVMRDEGRTPCLWWAIGNPHIGDSTGV
ncbi:hypothetical protein [Sphingomonas sp.]|uniref:hypothetical protein n=1 Tax=Sphingomonas sp. TaxID=28214 RepID=UPI0038A1BEF4